MDKCRVDAFRGKRNRDCAAKKKKLALALDIGVQMDMRNNNVHVRNNFGKEKDTNYKWLGEFSMGGAHTFSMAPKATESPFVSLVQVLARGNKSTGITHRLIEFAKYQETLEVLLTQVLKYWKSGWNNIKLSIAGEEEEEEEEEERKEEEEEEEKEEEEEESRRRRRGKSKGEEEDEDDNEQKK